MLANLTRFRKYDDVLMKPIEKRLDETFRLSIHFQRASPHSTLQIKLDSFWKSLQKQSEFLRGELSGKFPQTLQHVRNFYLSIFPKNITTPTKTLFLLSKNGFFVHFFINGEFDWIVSKYWKISDSPLSGQKQREQSGYLGKIGEFAWRASPRKFSLKVCEKQTLLFLFTLEKNIF